MAIKGMSEEVTAAFEFDPFAALSEQGGEGGSETPPAKQPPAQQPPQAERPRDVKTGQFTRPPKTTPTLTGQQQQPAAPSTLPAKPAAAAPASGGTVLPSPEEPKNTIAELMERIRDMPPIIGGPGAATPGPGAPPAQAPAAGAPAPQGQPQWRFDYSKPWQEQRINLPAPLLEAIFNEDRNVAAQGMGVLVNTMYNSIMNDVHTRVAEVLLNAPRMMQHTADASTAQNALRTKFYSKYRDLSDPVGMNTVYTLAKNVAAIYESMGQPVDPMSDDFIEYVGEQAMKMLGRVRVAQPKKTYQTGGSTRETINPDNPFMSAIGMA